MKKKKKFRCSKSFIITIIKREREREEKNEMKNLSHFLSLTVNDGENLVKKKIFRNHRNWLDSKERKKKFVQIFFLERQSLSLSHSLICKIIVFVPENVFFWSLFSNYSYRLIMIFFVVCVTSFFFTFIIFVRLVEITVAKKKNTSYRISFFFVFFSWLSKMIPKRPI